MQVFTNLFDNIAKYTPAGTHCARSPRLRTAVRAGHWSMTTAGPAARRPGTAVRQVSARHRGGRDRRRRASASPSARPSSARTAGEIEAHAAERVARASNSRCPLRSRARVTQAMHQVLVIEDEPAIRNILRALLGGDDYRFIEAETARAPRSKRAATSPICCSWTSACPTATALTSSAACAPGRRCPSSCCPRARWRSRRSRRWMPAPTTTSPSPSARRSCWRGCARRCGATRAVRTDVYCTIGRRPDRSRSAASKWSRRQNPPHAARVSSAGMSRASRGHGRPPAELVREVWGPERAEDARGLRVFMNSLRAKLEPDPRRPRYLVTEIGLGYRLYTDES